MDHIAELHSPNGVAREQIAFYSRRRYEEPTTPDPHAVLACEDNLAFIKKIPDEHIKLIVTSPPYNLGKNYEAKTSLNTYLETQDRVVEECVRILHPQGSICWQVGNYVENGEIVPLDTILYPIFKSKGLSLRNRIVWQFGHGLHCRRRLSGRYETINWWTKSDDYTWNLDPIRVPSKYPGKRHFKGPNVGKLSGNPKGKNPSDVWSFPNVKANHPEKTIHPCQFPRTIAKSGSSSVEPGDGLRWAEGAAFGSQGHGHLGRKPSLEAQGIQCRVDQGGECLAQTGSAQGVNVLIPAAVLHMMLAVLNAPVVAEQLEQPSGPTLT